MSTEHFPGGRLMSVAEAIERIKAGRFLSIAGDEALLRTLPCGNWIGGTIPYFMAQHGGEMNRDQVFVSEAEVCAAAPRICFHDITSISRICAEAPDNGYTVIIIPAFSSIHSHYARHAPAFEDMFVKPLVGWVSGVHLDQLGDAVPVVVNGQTGEFDSERAVVLHVPLAADRYAAVEIINLHHQGDGDRIRFTETGFSAGACLVNDVPVRLADYLGARAADLSLPLVADYCGAMINVSFKGVDHEHGRVDFYAPVFEGVEYRLAAPRSGPTTAQVASGGGAAAFSCNCILNYLYDGLEGRSTGRFTGPMTFGEIAWLLLNQTLVYLSIERV